ncbi:hypothetical protein SAMN02990966_01716 [Rhodospirillales bacterium URHD0017]|nr:hypothetical protein SAMN02990966_01716 [Rhodospirillales bacterium URHD0017]
MLGKAWGWLTARLGGQPHGRLRFSVHRHPAYQSFWRPSVEDERTPRLEIQIFLEATNMTNEPRRIATAEFEGMPSTATVVIGVRDAGTGKFAAANPLPPQRITVVSLLFLIDGQSRSADEPFHVTLLLTDDLGERHSTKVIMH